MKRAYMSPMIHTKVFSGESILTTSSDKNAETKLRESEMFINIETIKVMEWKD